MKETLKKDGVGHNQKIDYFKIVRNTPPHLRKKMSFDEFHKMIQDNREKKLKKAS